MNTHLLLEAAVRSLVMGAMIFVALRLLRIEQVRARRTAWLLALAGAIAMPLLVGAQIGPRLLPDFSFTKLQPVQVKTVALRIDDSAAPRSALAAVTQAVTQDSLATNQAAPAVPPASGQFGNTLVSLAVIGYCAVAAVLSLRLCAGVGFALRLRNQAERVIFPFDPELDARASARLATPVTVGSSVLLPKDYTLWDGATLRIVLSHERAHVRQKDFYVHAMAGLHCALFWFNPFSWWLQRQLSELGEALSDRAAVEQAESRASYAETLLAFATRTQWPLTSVAMASASNLTPRIERLLNDQGFERSFAPKKRLPIIAVGVVLLAMVASTSMVRVHAAVANGPLNANTVATNTTTSSTSTSSSPSTSTNSAGSADANSAAVLAAAKKKAGKMEERDAAEVDADDFDVGAVSKEADRAAHEADRAAHEADRAAHEEHGAAADAAIEEVLAIRSGKSRIMINSGRLLELRAQPSGDYIYFQHNGKPYLIQDPQIIEKAQELLAPMKELSEKQKELGHQQAMLGVQERMLVSQQRAIKLVETPEFKRDMEELQKRLKEVDLPRLTAQIDQRALAEVQAHIGEIQASMGHLQAEFGLQMHQFGDQQGKLGEQQGKLGEEQGRLGKEQTKIVEEARRQLKPIIEQAIRDGKSKPLSRD